MKITDKIGPMVQNGERPRNKTHTWRGYVHILAMLLLHGYRRDNREHTDLHFIKRECDENAWLSWRWNKSMSEGIPSLEPAIRPGNDIANNRNLVQLERQMWYEKLLNTYNLKIHDILAK